MPSRFKLVVTNQSSPNGEPASRQHPVPELATTSTAGLLAHGSVPRPRLPGVPFGRIQWHFGADARRSQLRGQPRLSIGPLEPAPSAFPLHPQGEPSILDLSEQAGAESRMQVGGETPSIRSLDTIVVFVGNDLE